MEISVTRRGPFAFGWIEGIGILANPMDWDMEGWLELCQLLARHRDAIHHYSVGMNYAPGRGPTDEEIRVWADYVPIARLHRVRRLALVTDLAATTAAQNAAVGVMPAPFPFETFGTKDTDRAFDWLHELSPFDPQAARRLLESLLSIVYSP